MQDILRAAADIKAAQLKERPGRQEWERAPEWFKYTAFPDKEVEAARQSSVESRLEICDTLKSEANARYESDDLEGALKLYTRAVSLFVWFDRGKDRSSEDIPCINSTLTLSDEDREEVNAVLASLFNNISSCLIKMSQPEPAIYAASKALDHDPYNVKALYRRAAAHKSLGTSMGLQQAVEDMKQANSLEPGNTQVRTTLALYQRELREQNRKDAALYGNMFARGQLYEEEPPQGAGDSGHSDDDTFDGDKDRPLGRNKIQDPSPEEVARTIRSMQHNMERAQQRRPRPPAASGIWEPFRVLPWWAWALIVLHLLYRIAKLWRIPVPGITWGPLPRMPGRDMDDHDEL